MNRPEILNASLPAGFGKRMTGGQKDLAFMLIVGLGLDAAELERETETIQNQHPGMDGMVAIFKAAGKLSRQQR